VRAVEGVDLEVARGQCLGVVGESGAGKSQLFLAVMGLLGANAAARGSARFLGQELLTLGGPALDRLRGPGMGMVFQDPMSSLTPHLRVGDQIAETRVRHLRESWRTARARAVGLLEQVHVADPARCARQYPHELSGGMRQRVMIAIALATEPKLLIADEPTSSLDVTISAQILALLLELKRTRAMTMVLITHDLGAVAGLADELTVMRAGRIVESGPVAQLLRQPREPYTRTLLREALELTGTLTGAAAPAAPGATALAVEDVCVDFPLTPGVFGAARQLRAVDQIGFELARGESLAIVGESGSGKSSLARAVLNLLAPTHGRVVWLGQGLAELPAAQLRRRRRELQLIFQAPLASLDPRMRAGEIVAEGLRVHEPALGAAERAAAVLSMFERVGLEPELTERYPHELSGGQCQRVGIARAMILKPALLVCDEPLSALDVSTQEQILSLLTQLQRAGGLSLIFISHNLATVKKLCDRVLVMYLGRMMELAGVGALYARPLHPYSRELLAAIPSLDPAVQPARLQLARAGEAPSALDPPSGCVYRTRCGFAQPRCAGQRPPVETDGTHQVACYRWRELPPAA
jgi:oligopeptide/dipeptide ABC transporter ATP-binding protein